MTRSCSLFVAVLLPFLQPSQEVLEYWPLEQHNNQAKPEKNEGPGHFCKQVAGPHMGYRCAHHRRSYQQSPNSRQKIRTDAEQQIFAHVQTLLRLRQQHPALQRGKQVHIVALSLDSEGTKITLIRFDQPAAQ